MFSNRTLYFRFGVVRMTVRGRRLPNRFRWNRSRRVDSTCSMNSTRLRRRSSSACAVVDDGQRHADTREHEDSAHAGRSRGYARSAVGEVPQEHRRCPRHLRRRGLPAHRFRKHSNPWPMTLETWQTHVYPTLKDAIDRLSAASMCDSTYDSVDRRRIESKLYRKQCTALLLGLLETDKEQARLFMKRLLADADIGASDPVRKVAKAGKEITDQAGAPRLLQPCSDARAAPSRCLSRRSPCRTHATDRLRRSAPKPPRVEQLLRHQDSHEPAIGACWSRAGANPERTQTS